MTVLPLPPTTNHGYGLSKGRMYKTAETRAWEQFAYYKLKLRNKQPLQGSVGVTLGFYFDSHRRKDIDGGIKFALDILAKAGLITDDSQISDLVVAKRYSKEAPRLEVELYQTHL